jgi:hypothetical protein
MPRLPQPRRTAEADLVSAVAGGTDSRRAPRPDCYLMTRAASVGRGGGGIMTDG